MLLSEQEFWNRFSPTIRVMRSAVTMKLLKILDKILPDFPLQRG